jgi:hypothetical protein
MTRDRHPALLLLGAVLLLSTSLVACATELTITTHISVQPEMISLSGRAGEHLRGQSLEIYSSAEIESLMWRAEDGATWLHLSPSWGTFDSGVS